MIRILIADDHKIFRKGLKQTIEDNEGLQVTGEAENGRQVLEMAGKAHYDLVILDVNMPDISGLEILKQLKAEHPDLPVIILSMYPEDQYAVRVLKAGGSGYLTKETDEQNLIAAIRKVHKGGKYVSPITAEKLAFVVEKDFEKPLHEKLSDREYQVMCLIAQGKNIGEVAGDMRLGTSTVSTYRSRILEKLGLKNNSEITAYAIRNKLVDQ